MNISKVICFLVLGVLVWRVQGLYSYPQLRKKLNKQFGLVFDARDVLRKIYGEESRKSMENSYQPDFDLVLSNTISRNILKMAHSIGSITNQQFSQNFLVFSPLSIATALALLLLGSDGKTNDELMRLFGFDENSDLRRNRKRIHEQFGFLIDDLLRNSQHPHRARPVDKWKYKTGSMGDNRFLQIFGSNEHNIEIANGIFVQKGFPLKPDYKISAENIYRGEIKTVDFQDNGEIARKLINEWAEKKTNGRIHEILAGGIPAKTNMILASTLYFKALWENAFIEEVTSKRDFYPDGKGNKPILADMMFAGGEFPFYNAKEYGCQIVGLPYKGNQTTMYVILPYDSDKGKLRELQKFLTAEKIEEIISNMQMTSVFVALPKMQLESSLNLKDILAEMGVSSLFSSSESDLSLIADGHGKAKSLHTKNTADHFKFKHLGQHDDYEGVGDGQRGSYKIHIDANLRKRAAPRRMYGERKLRRQARDVNSQYIFGRYINFQEPRIFVDEILHKTELAITEKGTEGGAATFNFFSRHDLDLEFRVDSPFLFLIRHDATKMPLFYGSVYNPVT